MKKLLLILITFQLISFLGCSKNVSRCSNENKRPFNSRKYEQEIEHLDKLLSRKPNNYRLWLKKGNAYFELKNYKEAIKCYDKAIEIKPDFNHVWNQRGICYYRTGNLKDAIYCFDNAIENELDNYFAWNNKGVFLYETGKYEEAMQCYNQAIIIDSDKYLACSNKGNALAASGKYEKAMQCYDKALDICPNNDDIWFNLACLYSLMKKKAEMLVYLKKSIDLYNKNKDDAKTDVDFKEYWNDPEFMELVK